MKTIILFLVSMVILTGCPTSPVSEGSGSDLPFKDVIYKGKVLVKTESGEPCKDAKVVLLDAIQPQPNCTADDKGYVIVTYRYRCQSITMPLIKSCEVYKYENDLNILKTGEVYLVPAINFDESDQEHTLRVYFPDSP